MIGFLKPFGMTILPVLALLGMTSGVMAQNEAQTTVNTTGWGVQCNTTAEGLQCAASLSMTSAPDNQRIITVSFQEADDPANPSLIVQLPFGLNLPRGIDIAIDDADFGTLEINTCLQAGCFVVQEAKQELLDAMVAGEILTVAMETSNGNATQLQIALDGFSDALARLE